MKTPRFRLLALGLPPIRLAPEEIHLVADVTRPGHMAVAVLAGDIDPRAIGPFVDYCDGYARPQGAQFLHPQAGAGGLEGGGRHAGRSG